MKDDNGKQIPDAEHPFETRAGFLASNDFERPRECTYYKCMLCGEAHLHKRHFKHDPTCPAA